MEEGSMAGACMRRKVSGVPKSTCLASFLARNLSDRDRFGARRRHGTEQGSCVHRAPGAPDLAHTHGSSLP